ncbi:MAG: hypothetical protein ORN54_07805 [Cyclobacteriaceae bacterium]|nr:hypothetical protein [Cyclobacteriaceae bacterium]
MAIKWYIYWLIRMTRFLFFLFISVVIFSSCGPDLNPQKYLIKNVLYSSYEEYSFQYAGGLLQRVIGTDSISLEYADYNDSTSIKQFNKSGKLTQRFQLVFSCGKLMKYKIRWQFGQRWYKDSITFGYSGSNLTQINYKSNSFQATTLNGNLTTLKRGTTGLLAVSHANEFDGVTNPFASVYWLDHFLLPNGFTNTLQPLAIARYFSKNNITTSKSIILGSTQISRFSYIYLHGILPKAINYELETNKTKVSNLVLVFDIQYTSKDTSGTSP